MPLALARKYRPKSFGAVAVQSHVSTTLKGAIAHDRIAHAYLLCGPRGTGKTTLARVLAMALNCERRGERADGEPCGECESCRRIWSGAASLDVIEIDAASNRGVDDARELRERAMYAPSGADRYKVYIVDEAHMLTREAWNALLKILEEPPARVVFVFATTEPQKIAQTAAPVLSRLQRFDLKRIGAAEIRHRLREILDAEGVTVEDEALSMLARAADGSMRDALSLTDQVLALGEGGVVSAGRVREALGLVSEDECLRVLDIVADRQAGQVFDAVTRLADGGVDLGVFLGAFAEMLRAQLAACLDTELPELSERARGELLRHRQHWSAGDVLRMLNWITELEPRFRRSGQQQLLLETILVRCALVDRSVRIEDLLRELDGGDSGGRAPAPRPPEPFRPMAPPPPPPRARSGSSDRADSPPPKQASPAGGGRVGGEGEKGARGSVRDRWPELVAYVRRERQAPMLAAALEQVTPEPGGTAESIRLRLTEPNEIVAQAIEAGRSDVLAAVRSLWPELRQFEIVQPEGPAPTAARRLTAESVRADQVRTLRRHDPVLGAAIDALDLELIE